MARESQIKLYRDENGKLKGDASICYLRKESIQLAIQMQDDCPLRYSCDVWCGANRVAIRRMCAYRRPYSRRRTSEINRDAPESLSLLEPGTKRTTRRRRS